MPLCEKRCEIDPLFMENLQKSWIGRVLGESITVKTEYNQFEIRVPRVSELTCIDQTSDCVGNTIHFAGDRIMKLSEDASNIALLSLSRLIDINDYDFIAFVKEYSKLLTFIFVYNYQLAKCTLNAKDDLATAIGLEAIASYYSRYIYAFPSYSRSQHSEQVPISHLITLMLISGLAITQMPFRYYNEFYKHIKTRIVKLRSTAKLKQTNVIGIGGLNEPLKWNVSKEITEEWVSCGGKITSYPAITSWPLSIKYTQWLEKELRGYATADPSRPFYEFFYRGTVIKENQLEVNSLLDMMFF